MQNASSDKKAGAQDTKKVYEISGSAAGYDTRHLTVTYIAALALVGLLVIFSYAILQMAIYQQVSDAPVINLSGRQRMLSQKITKETLLLTTSTTPEMIEKYHGLLESSLISWSRVHMGLQHGDKELRLPGNNSEEVRRLFAEMEPYYKKIESAVDKILLLGFSDLERISINTPIVQDVVEASPLYLLWMDRTVFQYDKEAGVHVDALKRYETYILIILLMILVLEAVFIFQPMVIRVRKTYRGLQQAKVETERHAHQAQAAKGSALPYARTL